MISIFAQLASMLTAPALAVMGVVAIAIPIAIHWFSRLRRQRQPWGAMRFLLEAVQSHRRRLQLEQWLLLAIRCLILGLLGLALAGPMVTGCAGSRGFRGFRGFRGRVVHIVIDDSLSTRASIGAGRSRFEQLQRDAQQLIDGLSPNDRVQIWRSARPAMAVTEQPSNDHVTAKKAMASLKPRWSRSDLAQAMREVVDELEKSRALPQDTMVIVLSDWARGVQQTPADEPTLQQLAQHATLHVTRPMATRSNIQIAQLKPRQAMVVAQADGQARVSVTLEAMRYGDLSRSMEVPATLSLYDDQSQVVTKTQRTLTWPAGQRRSVTHVDMVSKTSGGSGGSGVSGVSGGLVIRCELDPPAQEDALKEDNFADAIVTVRRQLSVGLVTPSTAHDVQDDITPERWLTLAMSPTGQSALTVQRVLPQAIVGSSVLPTLDAIMVMCPDRLNDAAWDVLAEHVATGALVWVWPPVQGTDATWIASMQRAFAMGDVSIGWEVVESQKGWPITSQMTPKALRLLGADYDMLLKPIRVWRRLPITAPQSVTWMSIQSSESSEPWLIASPHGQGQVLFSALALDMDWTNLPAKPLFVPLLHETLRGVLGEPRGKRTQAIAGSKPTLGQAWSRVTELEMMANANNNAHTLRMNLSHEDAQTMPANALTFPGVFVAMDDASLKLAVNVDAEAGDLTEIDEARLAQWFLPMGDWTMLERTNLANVFSQQDRPVRWGWPLLWIVMGLVILETMLARWLSHAKASPQDSWSYRVLHRLIAGRHDESNSNRKRAA